MVQVTSEQVLEVGWYHGTGDFRTGVGGGVVQVTSEQVLEVGWYHGTGDFRTDSPVVITLSTAWLYNVCTGTGYPVSANDDYMKSKV